MKQIERPTFWIRWKAVQDFLSYFVPFFGHNHVSRNPSAVGSHSVSGVQNYINESRPDTANRYNLV